MTNEERIAELEKQVESQSAQLIYLFRQMASLDAAIMGQFSDAYQRLSSLTGLQVAVMQMYQHKCSSDQITERLGIADNSPRQLKRRIVKKLGQSVTEHLPAYAQAISRIVSDEQYLMATGLPKNWYEKYGDCYIDEDPYAEVYCEDYK